MKYFKILALIMLGGFNAYTQPNLLKTAPTDLKKSDEFGYAISMDSSRAVVSAAKADGNNFDEGAVWIYDIVNGQLINPKKLPHPINQAFAHFGNDVVISGNLLLVGVYGSNEKGAHAGAVYCYKYDGTNWNLIQKIYAPDAKKNDNFGYSLDMEGTNAIIGAPGFQSKYHKGKAYVFKFDSNQNKWIQEKMIMPQSSSSLSAYGYDVAISSNILAISDPFANTSVAKTGSVETYFKNGNNWVMDATITPDIPIGNELFGCSIDLSESTLVIGASGSKGVSLPNIQKSATGSAFVYKKVTNTWRLAGRLVGDGASNNMDRFGFAVSIHGNMIAVGCNQDDFMAKNSGATYVFKNKGNSWQFVNKFIPSDGEANDYFGSSVSVFKNNLLVGARLSENDSSQADQGVVYFHSQVDIPLDLNEVTNEINIQNDVTVYPNPITSNSVVKITSKDLIEVVAIYDMSGKCVSTLTEKESLGQDQYSFPITDLLSSGMYMVNVKFSNHTQNFKILKQ